MLNFFKKHFGELIEHEISGLRDYCDVVEGFLEKEKFDISKKYDGLENIKHTHEDYYYKFTHEFEEEYFTFSVEYSNTFRFSIITLTYSFLESYLKKICDHIYRHKKLKFTIKDLGNSYIDNLKKYLTKTCDVDIGTYDEWKFIVKIQLLRNRIIHSRGEFEVHQKKSKLANFVEEHPSLSLKNHLHLDKLNKRDTSVSYEIIIVDKELGIEFIKNVEDFLLRLISEVFKEENTEDT